MTPIFRLTSLLLVAAVAVWGAGCDSASLSEGDLATVAVQMELGGAAALAGKAAADDAVSIPGENGTLTISDIRFILDEFELASDGEACADDSSESSSGEESADDDCAEFKLGPLFVDVPLGLDAIELLAAQVPLGVYGAFGFEIDNLESDDDSDTAADSALAALIRAEFPDWPDEASVAVVGRFEPIDGSPAHPFTIYVGAEIDVDLELDPALELTDTAVEKALTIALDVLSWIPSTIPGDLPDLSMYDYGTTGHVIPFELELEEGFHVYHHDRDED